MAPGVESAANRKPTVFVVDDDPGIASWLVELLGELALDVRTFERADELLRAIDDTGPACVLLDVQLADASGVDVQRTLRERWPDLPVVVITGHAQVDLAVAMTKAGAHHFLEKPIGPQECIDAVQSAIRRHRQSLERATRVQEACDRFERLTPREREVLDHVVSGASSREIAGRLGISIQAVDRHRERGMRKLELENVPDLVRLHLTATERLATPSRRER